MPYVKIVKSRYNVFIMAKVVLVQVVYNHRRFIPKVYDAIFAQGFPDFHMVAVIAGSDDGSKEYIADHYRGVEIIDPGYNIGFAKGHNLVFEKYDSEFFQLVNPDLIMEPDYVEKMLTVFEDERVGAATGKLLRYDFDNNRPTKIIDSTGVVLFRSGRARDRGQHEVDSGQYDAQTHVMGVSGAGCMYRRAALEAAKMPRARAAVIDAAATTSVAATAAAEYFDEDFHSYWEDVDLSWRMQSAGFVCRYVPGAIAYHGRGAGSSEHGYRHVGKFVKHHKQLSHPVRRRNYANHIFMFVKNSPRWYWQFFVRELMMFGYTLVFETATLATIPDLFKLLPSMLRKRAYIKQHRHAPPEEMEKIFSPGVGI